jgi:hypothetical protein
MKLPLTVPTEAAVREAVRHGTNRNEQNEQNEQTNKTERTNEQDSQNEQDSLT